MSILDDIREQYPQYQDVPDLKLAFAIKNKFYPDTPAPDFFRKAGLQDLVGLDQKYDPTEGMTGFQKFAAGAGKSVVDNLRGIGQLGAKALDIASLGQGNIDAQAAYDKLKQDQSQANARDAPLMATRAGLAGNITGQALQAVAGGTALKGAGLLGQALPAGYRGAALAGAAQGSLQPLSSDQTELSRLKNAGLGAAGGVAGQGIASGLGRAVGAIANPTSLLGRPAPEVAQLARAATDDYGIPLTAAQVAPSKVGKLLDSVSQKVPFSGAQAFRDQQQKAFNSAVAQTIGENTDAITPAVYAAAKKRIGGIYDDITSRNQIGIDDQVKGKLAGILQDAQQLGSDDSVKAVNGLLGRIEKQTVNDAIPGEAYQSIQSQLGKIAKSGGEKGNYAGQISGVLRDALNNSISDADQAAWQAANKQYANLKTIRDLVTKDQVNGNISPSALLGRVTANGAKKEAVASGRGGDLAELASIGQQFIKDTVPNSGTPERLMGYGLLGGAGWANLPATLGTLGASRAYQTIIRQPQLVARILADPAVDQATKSQLRQMLQSLGWVAPGAGGLVGQSTALGVSK